MRRPLVTLHELRTVYSLKDLYDMVEVNRVMLHNEHVAAKIAAAQREGR